MKKISEIAQKNVEYFNMAAYNISEEGLLWKN